jgi:tetratricopeptide (TPR) repeat protein
MGFIFPSIIDKERMFGTFNFETESTKPPVNSNSANLVTAKLESPFLSSGQSASNKMASDKIATVDSQAIDIDSDDVNVRYQRGRTWTRQNQFSKAIAEFDETIRLDPHFLAAYRRSAWLRATCSDAAVRDGKRAVLDVTKACELSDWDDDESLMILAAALAEAGQIEEAQRRLEQSIEKSPQTDARTKAKMQACFQNGQAFREEPFKKLAIE